MRIRQARQTSTHSYMMVQEWRFLWIFPVTYHWVGMVDYHTGFITWYRQDRHTGRRRRPNWIINAALTSKLDRLEAQGHVDNYFQRK